MQRIAALTFLALSFSPSATQTSKWQTDWPLFVAELSQHLRKGIDPSKREARDLGDAELAEK